MNSIAIQKINYFALFFSKNLFAKLAKFCLKKLIYNLKKLIPQNRKKEKIHHIKIIGTSIVLAMASK
jgi:uncharacterized FlgJ-related protein